MTFRRRTWLVNLRGKISSDVNAVLTYCRFAHAAYAALWAFGLWLRTAWVPSYASHPPSRYPPASACPYHRTGVPRCHSLGCSSSPPHTKTGHTRDRRKILLTKHGAAALRVYCSCEESLPALRVSPAHLFLPSAAFTTERAARRGEPNTCH